MDHFRMKSGTPPGRRRESDQDETTGQGKATGQLQDEDLRIALTDYSDSKDGCREHHSSGIAASKT